MWSNGGPQLGLSMRTGQQTVLPLARAPMTNGLSRFEPLGLRWLDDTRVRVAWAQLPDHPDRTYDVPEVLRTPTVAVPGG